MPSPDLPVDRLRAAVDGSLHVTNGGVHPVLTVFANAYRVMDAWLGSSAGASSRVRR